MILILSKRNPGIFIHGCKFEPTQTSNMQLSPHQSKMSAQVDQQEKCCEVLLLCMFRKFRTDKADKIAFRAKLFARNREEQFRKAFII